MVNENDHSLALIPTKTKDQEKGYWVLITAAF